MPKPEPAVTLSGTVPASVDGMETIPNFGKLEAALPVGIFHGPPTYIATSDEVKRSRV
jgi:hypothetical protein